MVEIPRSALHGVLSGRRSRDVSASARLPCAAPTTRLVD
jgi:hypothetical protein